MTEFLAGPSREVSPKGAVQRLDPNRLLIGSVALAGVALLSLLVATASGLRTIQLQLFCMALLTAVIGLLPWLVDQAHAERRHIVFTLLSIVLVLYYAFPAFARYVPASGLTKPGSYPATLLSQHDVLNGQIVALVGVVTLLISYSSPIGLAITRRLPRPRYDWPANFTLLVAAGMLAAGWMITAAMWLGMVPMTAGTGVTGTLGSGRFFGLVMLTLIWLRYRSPAAALLILIVVPMSMGLGMFTGKKRAILVSPAIVTLTWALERRRVPGKWILAGVVGLVVIYPANEFYRQVVLADRTISPVEVIKKPIATTKRVLEYSATESPGEYVALGMEAAGHRLDGIGSVSVVVRETPSRVPFQRGETLWRFFAAFVPRLVWPNKPDIMIGKWITTTYGGNPEVQSHTAPTQIGEYYLNFGIPGVIGGMLLLGLVLRVAQEYVNRKPTIPALTALMIIMYFLVTRFESTIASMYANVVFVLTPLALAHGAGRVLGLLDRGTKELRSARPAT